MEYLRNHDYNSANVADILNFQKLKFILQLYKEMRPRSSVDKVIILFNDFISNVLIPFYNSKILELLNSSSSNKVTNGIESKFNFFSKITRILSDISKQKPLVLPLLE